MVTIIQKLVAILVYAALLLPGNENRLATWARATEVFSTALDRTLRRRKSRVENERFIQHLKILRSDADQEERTHKFRIVIA